MRPAAGRLGLLLSVVVTLTASACSVPTDPTTTPTAVGPSIGEAIACYRLPLEQCHDIADVALATLAGQPPVVWLAVGPPLCSPRPGPCPAIASPGDQVDTTIHFAGAGPRYASVLVEEGGGFRVADSGPAVGIELEPESVPGAVVGAYPYTLGHCGVYSPIDFDGSFWDPLDRVDGRFLEVIDQEGTFVLLTPTTARFTTPDGFVLDLVRHPETKSFPGCA